MQRTMKLDARVGVSLAIGLGLFLSACFNSNEPTTIAETRAPISTTPSRIAITIDDLPYVMPSRTSPADGLLYTTEINASLKRHDIVATGFVVGQHITPQSRPALQAFADAGHTIGNHSWSHPDYGTLTRAEFLEETQKTHVALAPWLTEKKFYRFPFLREGETEATKAAATQVLAQFGYQNVPVTIDNDEWKFNADYLEAIDRNEPEAAAKIAQDYIAHMQERTAFFQDLAVEQLDGDVDHVLLIHLNRINADHLGTLLDWYDAQGWSFIPVEDALTHPLFARPDIYAGPRGLSQIERVLGKKFE